MNRYNLSPRKKLNLKMSKGRNVTMDPLIFEAAFATVDIPENLKSEDIIKTKYMRGAITGSFGNRWVVKWDNGFEFAVPRKFLNLIHE